MCYLSMFSMYSCQSYVFLLFFYKFHCHSVTRICFECMIRYCQLNRSQKDRTDILKCLFCNETCDPKKLTYSNTFQFDFFLHNQLYPDKTECPFCFTKVSNIFNHLEICPSSYVQCSCGYITLKQIHKYHFIDCSDYKKCPYCNDFIQKDDWFDHLYHKHDMVECNECRKLLKRIIK